MDPKLDDVNALNAEIERLTAADQERRAMRFTGVVPDLTDCFVWLNGRFIGATNTERTGWDLIRKHVEW